MDKRPWYGLFCIKLISSSSTIDDPKGCSTGSITKNLEEHLLDVKVFTLKPRSVLFSELLSFFLLKNELMIIIFAHIIN